MLFCVISAYFLVSLPLPREIKLTFSCLTGQTWTKMWNLQGKRLQLKSPWRSGPLLGSEDA